jgi:hypothetical protein
VFVLGGSSSAYQQNDKEKCEDYKGKRINDVIKIKE